MPLNQLRLKNNIKTAFEMMQQANGNATATLDILCGNIATAIIDEIKELNIVYTNGLVVGGNPVTGVINHTVQ